MSEFLSKSNRKTIGEVSIDTKIIFDLIRKAEIADIITYDQMSESIGRSIKKNRSLLQSARRMAMRECSLVFDCQKNIGIKRISDTQIIKNQSTEPVKRMQSIIRRSTKQLSCVNQSQLLNDDRIKMNATLSLLGVIQEFSKSKSIDTIQNYTSDILPIGKTLELFRG